MATDKKPSMTRKQAEAHLAAGEHLAIAGRHITHKRDLPPKPADAEGEAGSDHIEAVVARTADGKLTHAGMEHAIRSGGSVMHKGEVLTSLDDLPDEAELAKHDQQASEALTKSYDDQIATLQQQKAKLAQTEKPVEPKAETHAHAPAHPHTKK